MKKKYMVIFLTGMLVVGGAGTETFATSLIGHWDFEEGSGETAIDSSGNTLNGTISNAVYTAGKIGSYALDFNGSNSYVQVGFSPLLNPDSISISLWFKPRTNQQVYADILDKGHGAYTNPYYGGYVFQYEGSSSTIYTGYGNGSTFPGLSSGASYKDEQWHFIVANLGEAEIALYMDGQLVSKQQGEGAIVDNDSPLFIGRHRYLNRYFNGLIDDIRIFDGPLSQTDVTQLYQSANPVPEPATMLLFGTGIAGWAGTRLRRKKQ